MRCDCTKGSSVADNRRTNRRWLRPVIHLSVLAAVVWGVRRTIQQAVDQLGEFQWQLDARWLAAAAALYIAGMLPMGLFWFLGLRAMGQRPGLGETLRAFYIGHLGKYVPGKFMVIVLRTGLIRGVSVNTGVAAASVFLETLTMMAVGSFLAAGVMIIWFETELTSHRYLVPLAIGLMVLSGLPTLPPIFRRVATMLGVGRDNDELKEKLRGVGFGIMLAGWLMTAVGWVILSLSLWAVLQAMHIDGLLIVGHLHFYIAAVTLAVVAGFLSLIPGGAGVREAVLLAILGEIFFGEILRLPLASAAALGAAVIVRLVWLASECLTAAVLFFLLRRKADAANDAKSNSDCD